MSVGLILLTNRTAGNEVFHKRGESWPPEILLQDSLGMKDPHMSQERGGVDGVKQGGAG